MNPPTFFARDGEVYYRHGLWVPQESAERLLALFRAEAKDTPYNAPERKLVEELTAAMTEAYLSTEIAA